jgi:hypothetical protein
MLRRNSVWSPLSAQLHEADWIMNVAQSVELAKLNQNGFSPKDTRVVEDVFKGNVEGKDELGPYRPSCIGSFR